MAHFLSKPADDDSSCRKTQRDAGEFQQIAKSCAPNDDEAERRLRQRTESRGDAPAGRISMSLLLW
ncbi:hypothetical protein C5689_10580 [Methylosinus sporium]|uniref:Uncharacterized protein n=1 Tax=Methylosinus sporium TaxID=428 RepID=A0A2U1SQI7_METSR|nr:hypothetical protein C5689_10580 [Methylosinus sporium]